MINKITYRPYQDSDKIYLEDVIRKTWNYDSFCSEKVAKQMARVYLISCLSYQSFTKVALVDNIPVGIIMGKNLKNKNNHFKYTISKIKAGISLLSSKEGRRTASIFKGINNLDIKLLKSQNKLYDGEVAFFAIDESCRGMGIGKALFNYLNEYFKSNNISTFYLYTDTTCNYGFYEHVGMTRCAEEDYEVLIKLENKMTFYMYEGEITY